MVISTVTLNPAIDKTYFINRFELNTLNRAWKVKTNIGGKGINVSLTMAKCGARSLAGGFLSGSNGKYIEEQLKQAGVGTYFVYTEGETRVNAKVADLEKNTYTDINECGPGVGEADIKALFREVAKMAAASDVLHMGGSFHPDIPPDIYKRLIGIAHENGAAAVLDAEAEALRLGIEAAPDIVKPNQLELEIMIGRKIKSVSDAGKAAMDIVSSGVGSVLVSLGGNGAVAADKSGIYRAYPLHVPVNSTVGAGDSFLSGFLYGKLTGAGFAESLKYAISFASAKIQLEGTDIPGFSNLVEGYNSVVVEKIA